MSKEVSTSRNLVCLASSPRHMPPDWKPPASAWAASFAQQTTPVVMAYFGTQLGERDYERRESLPHEFFARANGPDNLEGANYVDRSGCRTLISSAYWTNPASYERWNIQSGFDAWWNDPARMQESHGYFREILTVPTNRFETISTYNTQVGVARTGCPLVGPIREHNYWGSMRDRLQVSADNPLLSAHGEQLPRLGCAATLGRRLCVKVPENLAIIRSGQDWTDCAGAELAEYTIPCFQRSSKE